MTELVTKFEKDIYNLYLKSLRKGGPYKKRENFDNFIEEMPEVYISLKKLCKLFESLPAININLFFESPYKIYGNAETFYLDFYASPKAIKCYREYIKLLMDSDPDNSNQLFFIKESILFISRFCKENNIKLKDYLTNKNGELYSWMLHLIEMKVSIYVIFGFNYFGFSVYSLFGNVTNEQRDMFLSKYVSEYQKYKEKLENSKIAKDFIKRALKVINNK